MISKSKLTNGTSFSNGGSIHYKDGRSYSVNLGFSISGQPFSVSAGIGSQVKSPTEYAIWIPAGSRRLAYVNKEYKVLAYRKYWVHPMTGQKVFQGYTHRSVLQGLDFTTRVA